MASASVSNPVRLFFEAFERNSNLLSFENIGAQYNDVFLFANPQGVRVVNREDFLKALPQRRAFFEGIGLKQTVVTSLEERRLDDHYILVEAHISMHFEKDPANPLDNEDSSTFILFQQDQSLMIACQIEHHEVVSRMQALGLLPTNS
jgi:hypothetical protein